MPTAAFFRLEGVLVDRPALVAAGWLAARAPDLRDRVTRLAAVALAAPLGVSSPWKDASGSVRLAWSGCRGLSRDRLEELGETYARDVLQDRLRPVGLDLLGRARAAGHRVVLVSEHLGLIAEPLAAHLRVRDVLANRMTWRGHRATGRLADPVVTGPAGAALVRAWAESEGVDLAGSAAYAAHEADHALLSAVGHPCLVTPDRGLRHLARDLSWPVVEA